MTDVLFWSGGKDSYLALLSYIKDNQNELVLLTTYNKITEKVPFQEISLHEIQHQAKKLNLPLLTIPLPSECPNALYIEKVTSVLQQINNPGFLIFGDLWIEDIRNWREKTFAKFDYQCQFPLWKKSYTHLLKMLWESSATVHISNVSDTFKKYIKIGDIYDQNFIDSLPDFIDPMGEKGEFHTQVNLL